jgi:GH15 family glucan-1,4-alpha-glucosidase
MLPARFTFGGDIGEHDWWDFQLDGYGTWLWAAAQHSLRHSIDPERWRPAAELTVDYLVSSWNRPCFDWWEEHDEQVHISTLGCIAAGLNAAADSGLVSGVRADAARTGAADVLERVHEQGVADRHLVKWIGSSAVDGSLSALISPLGVLDPRSPLAQNTIAAVEEQLSVEGGVHRFLADSFYGGGRWPLLTCFLGLAQAATGDRVAAARLLDWAAATATDNGFLPEQVDGHLLFPERRQEWVDRWGTVATPLLWSHAMVLRLAAELGVDRTEVAA